MAADSSQPVRLPLDDPAAARAHVQTVHGWTGSLRQRMTDLHSKALAKGAPRHPEFSAAFDDLATALVELQITEEELREQADELIAARERIEAERQRYRELFEEAPDAYLVTDPGGKILEANRAALELFGADPARVTGRLIFRFLDARARRGVRQLLADAAQTERISGRDICLRPRPDSVIEASVTVSAIAHPDGQVAGLRWIIRDVTVQRQADARHRELEAEQAARAQSEATIRLRTEFLSSISHDLRSPLTTIKGLAQLLERQAGRPSVAAAELLPSIADINAAATTMAALVAELADLTLAQAGQPLDLDLATVDLVALVGEAVSASERIEHGRSITFEPGAAHIEGSWDGGRLARVVNNLLDNAIKYSPAGGTIAITCGLNDDGTATLAIRDHGIGIPAADLPRVFERFHRGANATAQFRGTGIGLAGAHQIVEQHGGSITIESDEGLGTTVTVRLPIHKS